MMGLPPSEIFKWKSRDVFLMLRFMKSKQKPSVVEIEDVQTLANTFGAEVNG